MAIVTLPTFVDLEIVTPAKMNALVAALNAKFAGGFDSSDIQWPLSAGGDLSMGTGASGYSITGGLKIFNVINAANYATLQDAVTAAGTGGCVFIPPDTTVTASGVAFTGDGVAIIGAGPSSEILLTSGSTAGFLLRSATTGQTGFMLANLTLNGNTHTGTGQQGVILRRVTDAFILDVTFKDFSGPALQLTNDGTDGHACQRVYISRCTFSGGDSAGAYHILANDVADVFISNCVFTDSPDDTIRMAAGAAAQLMKRIHVTDNTIKAGAGSAVYIIGNNGTASANWADVIVSHNTIDSLTGTDPAIVVGTTGGRVRRVSVTGNHAPSSPGDGVSVCAEFGSVRDNILYSAAGDGIDLTSSDRLDVVNNDLRTSGAYGIDAHLSTNCVAHDNRTQSSVTGAIYFAATLRQWANGDTVGALPYTSYFNADGASGGGGVEVEGSTVTIPANTLRAGDVLHIMGSCATSGTADTPSTAYIRLKPTGGSEITLASVEATGNGMKHSMQAMVAFISSTTALALGFGGTNNTNDTMGVDHSKTLVVNTATSITIYINMIPHANVSSSTNGLIVSRLGGGESQ